jgi:hypothetical protein
VPSIAVLLLADPGTPEAMGRMANALTLAQEANGADGYQVVSF